MSYVVLAGLFEPGTVVSLYEVEGPWTLRFDDAQHPLVGRRVADAQGSVGFDGLGDAGKRYIARGTDIWQNPIEERARGLADTEGTELAQRPIYPAPNPVGTGEVLPPAVAPGAPAAILHTGIPAGVPVGHS
jgi:hypothetical protein